MKAVIYLWSRKHPCPIVPVQSLFVLACYFWDELRNPPESCLSVTGDHSKCACLKNVYVRAWRTIFKADTICTSFLRAAAEQKSRLFPFFSSWREMAGHLFSMQSFLREEKRSRRKQEEERKYAADLFYYRFLSLTLSRDFLALSKAGGKSTMKA